MWTTKKSWVIRGNTIHHDHPLHEEFPTREQARQFKRTLKGLGNWENVRMYKATETVGKGVPILIVLSGAR